ncbi:Structural maintenance of chromosomes protein 2 [Papilio xuthus]|uniref:Structural maintenance of chromosomes protein 2 n=1 Tax=Papilio xuthus TaxID=66420 RepID=A0A194PRA8_PAPXU|nr:Structural maintenance of chromosomes protein 2 [Papilio xuthus]
MSRLGHEEERCSEAARRARAAASEARGRREAAEGAGARLQRCEFRYEAPLPDFDRGRVAGTVCRLVDVRDPAHCTALETAAGGRLYNVVVDTEVTSKLLLERGRLQTRTTIIPLNKISARVIDRDTLRVAQEVGGGAERVRLALELVTFPERVRPAMRWVFGSTLVCADLDTARRVTFHPRVRCRCVTLEGDVVDPAGTLSGGARIKGGSVLLQLQELKQLEAAARAAEEELAACDEDLARLQRLADQHNALKQKVEMSSHALEVLRARVAATAHAQLHDEIDALQRQVEELGAAVERDLGTQREAEARAADLEAKVRDIKGHREREFKKAEEALRRAKLEAESDSASWKLREREFETLKLEVAELRQAAAAGDHQLAEGERAAEELHRAHLHAAQRHRAAAEKVKDLQAQIKQKKAEIGRRNADVARLAQRAEALGRTNADLELAIKQLQFGAKELQAEAVACQKKIKSLEESNAWITSEREYFGAAGGLYDFEGRGAGAGAAGERLVQLRDRRDKLARGLNARAHTLLGKEEDQYQDVMRKKKIVEADRAKLVQVMAELDEKKKLTLIAACEQVNRDFGSIFSSLLPGAQARLTPPPGLTVLEGLEVKVGFNRVWKESLGELSGGQRSLVALSLVLAMLLFKPAPLYILDEVDAALDLSHTQNIGQMLKEHFKHSQFIIVSLKDGMFNNANVLFRTRFVDGMSTVQRTLNTPRS